MSLITAQVTELNMLHGMRENINKEEDFQNDMKNQEKNN